MGVGTNAPALTSAVPQAEMPPLDLEAALYRFGDDRIFMMELCSEFTAGLPNRLAEIRSAIEAKDANKLGRLGHNLKGIALNFSAEPLANLALKTEEMGKREDLTNAAALLQELDAAVRALQDYYAVQVLNNKEQP